ncbi:MAG: recombinase family protein [Cetobacterium sp.]
MSDNFNRSENRGKYNWKIIKYIFTSRLNRNSLRAISAEVEENFQKKVPKSTVSYILKNRAYMGIFKQDNDKTIEIPAIISKNIFYRANKIK